MIRVDAGNFEHYRKYIKNILTVLDVVTNVDTIIEGIVVKEWLFVCEQLGIENPFDVGSVKEYVSSGKSILFNNAVNIRDLKPRDYLVQTLLERGYRIEMDEKTEHFIASKKNFIFSVTNNIYTKPCTDVDCLIAISNNVVIPKYTIGKVIRTKLKQINIDVDIYSYPAIYRAMKSVNNNVNIFYFNTFKKSLFDNVINKKCNILYNYTIMHSYDTQMGMLRRITNQGYSIEGCVNLPVSKNTNLENECCICKEQDEYLFHLDSCYESHTHHLYCLLSWSTKKFGGDTRIECSLCRNIVRYGKSETTLMDCKFPSVSTF